MVTRCFCPGSYAWDREGVVSKIFEFPKNEDRGISSTVYLPNVTMFEKYEHRPMFQNGGIIIHTVGDSRQYMIFSSTDNEEINKIYDKFKEAMESL
jgi:hypothetical protein